MASIYGHGWELLVVRQSVQVRGQRIRTVGTYRVYHDGTLQNDPALQGQIAESKGPGANHPAKNGRRIEDGRYALATQGTSKTKYHTFDYVVMEGGKPKHKPGFEITVPGPRTGILVHPGIGFLASVGCFNPCTFLPDETENISYPGSRLRVIALIDDMKNFLGAGFPATGEKHVPNAFAIIDGEP